MNNQQIIDKPNLKEISEKVDKNMTILFLKKSMTIV